ncbi:MAG: hypothetical protein JKX85_01535, partial [Phycisphaeraceae bacterium]|nr:hypothetical protein [Phycisphaeraceae bacterium]
MSYPSFKEHQRNLRVVTAVATHDRTDLLSMGVLIFLAVAMILLVSVNRANAKPRTAEASQMEFANNIQQSTWTNSNCNNCHVSDALFSHPVNVPASMSVPLGMPLENGRVTCITCHDNSSSQLHMIARVNHSPMLRDTGAVSLCQQCHDPMQSSRTAMHGAMLGQAHMTPMSTRRSFGSMPKRSFIRKVSRGASGAFVGGEKKF